GRCFAAGQGLPPLRLARCPSRSRRARPAAAHATRRRDAAPRARRWETRSPARRQFHFVAWPLSTPHSEGRLPQHLPVCWGGALVASRIGLRQPRRLSLASVPLRLDRRETPTLSPISRHLGAGQVRASWTPTTRAWLCQKQVTRYGRPF